MNIQEQYKNITLYLADHLAIKVHPDMNLDHLIEKYGKSSAPKTFIENGELFVSNEANWSLAIHELLHIAVVEPEYRHMLTHDTQKSYAAINKISPELKKYRSESATLGLQYQVYSKFQLVGYLGGGFFQGNIRRADGETCVPRDWRHKGYILFNKLFGDIL